MDNNLQFGRVGVLMGGSSTEHDISLKSGKAVYEALKNEGLDVMAMEFTFDKKEEIIKFINASEIDAAFIALHGRFGEDGSLQAILEELDIPYTGSGVKASKLAMDKIVSRDIFKKGGLNVPSSSALNKFASINPASLMEKFKNFPLVVKPATHGSSIGISFVDDLLGLQKAIDLAFEYDDNILVEEYIPGWELTVSVLDEEPLPVVEIIPAKRFFDYEAKYTSGITEYVCPAQIDEKTKESVQRAGLKAHQLLNCQGFSRVDIILDKDGRPFVLEVNTIPGLTLHSLLPKAAKAVGIEFPQLCLRMLSLAYEKKQLQKSTQKY